MAESKQEVAFRYAVERVNANRKILSQSLLSAIIEKIPPQDSFHASKRGKKCYINLLICKKGVILLKSTLFKSTYVKRHYIESWKALC